MRSLFLLAVAGLTFASAPTESLTGLPLYPGSGNGMDLPKGQFCKSAFEGRFYSSVIAKIDVVNRWYTSQLAGIHRVHVNQNGRSQDTFFNPAGTLEVTVTGSSGTDTTEVYAISYGRFTPALSAIQLQTFNTDTPKCK